MKVNVFIIENDKVDDLTVELEDNGSECAEHPRIYAGLRALHFSGNRFCNTFFKNVFRAEEMAPPDL